MWMVSTAFRHFVQIELIQIHGRDVSLGVGTFCFPIENGVICPNNESRAGSELKGQLKTYEAAYALAEWAWKNQLFDRIVDNSSYAR